MSDSLSSQSNPNLEKIIANVNDLKLKWAEILEELKEAKELTRNDELFTAIEYLTTCDQISKTIYLDLKELAVELSHLSSLSQKIPKETNPEVVYKDIKELRNHLRKALQKINSEYKSLAEETLRRSEDLIAKNAELIQRKKSIPNLNTEINQGLDEELFLQELRDSLETYRQAREEFISELTLEAIRKLPSDEIPEDLGEERPEIDPIISQLDTAITACDTALLIKEINE